MSLLESFVKNVFEKRVKPERGAILRCDLLGSLAHHTGVYLGDDRIAEVTEDEDGWAVVREVTPETFLNGEGTSLNRSGAFIYVATDDDEVIAEEQVASLAEAMIGSQRGEYNLLTNNCHRFTCHCILGENPDDMKLTDNDVAEALEETFGVSSVKWNSTGFGCGDDSFDDVEYDNENDEEDDEEGEDDDFDEDEEDEEDDDLDEVDEDEDFDDDDDEEDDDFDEDDEDEDEDDDEDEDEDDDEDNEDDED
ncbi:MAG: lecithin retinol acyltransferase family protein [Kiritimatiellae bacterium]|nr:lecithin retinol acyltransferase family protein [Kiritimatiellia bacterium]